MNPENPQPHALAPGTRLGAYEVLGKIGVGGMGEVYRGTDTKLRRSVAIKVLPPGFAEDPERLARFAREAQLLAQLHHPNIASIFGLEESDGVRALVLELVEGPTLAERLEAGPLGLETSVGIAVQIARALEHAHEKGIVHRDLKPQNIKAPIDGDVKVLDFGLAKAIEAGATGSPVDLSMSPTMLESPTVTDTHGTQIGAILGTAAYMAPEQAKGMAVDKRADIWAFGVVLYEMLVGRSLFAGDSLADTLAGVLKTDIDLSSLLAATPAALHRLLRQCLERNPRNRLHDIADARIVLEEIARDDGLGDPSTSPQATGRARWLSWGIAVLAMAAAAVAWLPRDRSGESPTAPLTVFGVLVPEGNYLARYEWPPIDVSADGRTVLVVAEGEEGSSVFMRSVGRLGFTRIAGTEGAQHPLLSPDGRSIAYFADGHLRKIPVEGGASVALSDAQTQRGATWAPDGSIVFSPSYNSGLWRVPGTGGSAVPVTTLDESRGERTHRWPQMLPGGNAIIFTVGLLKNTSAYDISTIDAVRLDTGERLTVLEGARMARYANGYLVFQRNQTLLAVRFDPVLLQTVGEPFVIREGVGGDASSGSGYFDVSADGALVFIPEALLPNQYALVLVDREGNEVELPLEPESYLSPRFSPSGDRIALNVGSGGLADDNVYLYERESERLQRLTFSQSRGFPAWSPDGRNLAFTVGTAGAQGLATKRADGSGVETNVPLPSDESHLFLVNDWLPDGRLIVTDVQRSVDIYSIDLQGGALTPLLADPTTAEMNAAVSPDGRFIAYSSSETGSNQVFVETFPMGGGRWQVSVRAGACPVWSKDGSELFFADGSTIMAADVDLGEVFRSGPPRELMTGPYRLCRVAGRDFDVDTDGSFVLVRRTLVPGQPREMVFLRGWESADPALETDR